MTDYERIIPEFAELGGLALEISGEGEPVLSPMTMPIIRLASDLGLWTALITNGHLLTVETIQELRNLKVALVLSMHGMTKEMYEQDNHKPGSFDEKMRTLRWAWETFKGSSWIEQDREIRRLCLHWTFQANNRQEMAEAQSICAETGTHFSVAPLAPVGHAKNRPDLWVAQDLAEINQLGDESIIVYDEPDGRQICGTCRYGLNIGADGNLLIDAHSGYEVGDKLGNIRNLSAAQAVERQHRYAARVFDSLGGFCPPRDPDWAEFLASEGYLEK